MISILDRSKGPVIGIKVEGKVTAANYTKLLRPRFLATIKQYGTLRLIFIIDDDFKGWSSFYSFLEDMWTMVHVRRHLERVASVAHPSKFAWLAEHSSRFIKGESRVFDPADEKSAWQWLYGLENILLEEGIVDKAELDRRAKMFKEGSLKVPRVENPKVTEDFLKYIKEGFPSSRDVKGKPKFKVGDNVLTRNMNPTGHTRLPRYARGKSGIVARVHEAFVFPDSNASGLGENPQHLYTVRFEGKELWGEDRSEEVKEALYLNLWESYLEHDR